MKALQTNRQTRNRKRETSTALTPSTDGERTKADIIAVATKEFAEKGLSGARIDEIAERTKTSKRMIYYYFKSKTGLYISVLEEAYRKIRNTEHYLQLDHLSPEDALRKLVGFTFDHLRANPDYIRLVINENLHYGRYLKQSKKIQLLNIPAIDAIRRILERGVKDGVFRKDVDPIDTHMSIAALSFFNVSNRYTFSITFKIDMASEAAQQARKARVVEMIVESVRARSGSGDA